MAVSFSLLRKKNFLLPNVSIYNLFIYMILNLSNIAIVW